MGEIHRIEKIADQTASECLFLISKFSTNLQSHETELKRLNMKQN